MRLKLVILTIILVFNNCKKAKNISNYTKLQGLVFGTTYHITYEGTKDFSVSIDSLFTVFNNSLSTYIPNSIISKVNRDEVVELDKYFVEAYNKAKRIHKETDGYFDPTIGKLINAYGFGSGKEKKDLSIDEIFELMKITGFDKVKLKDNKMVKMPGMEFNVNAFAKGQGVDVIGRFLESKGIYDYLVEIGGEIRARGLNSKSKLWRVAIDDPNTDGTRSQSRIIELDNQSMATSGNYRKFKINSKGEKVVHTINPKTGLAQENSLLSASVMIKGDCADVDAYATAFLAMGLEKTKEFLSQRNDLKVVLLYSDSKGNLQEFLN